MTQAQLDKFEKSLLEERKELMEDLLKNNENFNNLEHFKDGDLVDQAYNFYEKELLIGLSTNEKETLKSIDTALEKIKKKKFGLCEMCNKQIDEKRLEAIPYAKYCMECKKKKKNSK
ncbi:MAG: TraR/DksA C4-type zinc finger protein [Spirochaetota bacterium]|nr:TraR/DksA C4-type zinc finger protein [Spirochaetota bacterium]